MYSTICYEERLADISSGLSNSSFPLMEYITCSPPTRLGPKGVVVLLHGAFQTNYQFRSVIDIFAMAGFITVAPNLPGKRSAFSTSDARPSKSKSKSQLARDLKDLLCAIDIREPVHIVGHGFGADIALRFALKYPPRTASVTLAGKDTGRPSQGLTRLLERSVTIDLPSLSSALQSMTSNPATFTRNDLEEYHDTLTDPDTLSAMRTFHSSHPDEDTDLANSKHPPSSVPCLVLTGSDDSTLQPKRLQNFAAAYFNGPLEFCSIEGAKMLLAEEKPDDFAIEILRFLHTTARTDFRTTGLGVEGAESDGLAAKL